MKQTGFAIPAVLLVMIGVSACARSPGYRRDQDYVRNDVNESYYAKSRGTPTQRVESMGQPRKRVYVLNYWNDTPMQKGDLGAFAADELRRSLFNTQRVLLPTDIRTDYATQDFIQGDKVRVAQLIREGRKMGVSVLVIGRISKVVFRQRGDEVGLLRQKQSFAAVDVEVKVFDSSGGREVAAISKSGEASNNALVALEGNNLESQEFRAELTKLAIRNATVGIFPEVIRAVEKMTWEGRVVKVVGTKVYVNAGKASGLIPGDILKVLTQGDDVYDPQTGAFLGRSKGQEKGTLELLDFIGSDGAVTEIHSGANFQENDVVLLY